MSLGQFALLYTALAVGMPAGLASLVLQAQVVVTALLSGLLLHERPTRPQVIGILVGVVGLGVVAVGRSAATPALGLVLVVAAATSWAVGNVAARRAATHATTTRPEPRRNPPIARGGWFPRRAVDDGVVCPRGPPAPVRAGASRSTGRCRRVRPHPPDRARPAVHGIHRVARLAARLRHLEHAAGTPPDLGRRAVRHARPRRRAHRRVARPGRAPQRVGDGGRRAAAARGRGHDGGGAASSSAAGLRWRGTRRDRRRSGLPGCWAAGSAWSALAVFGWSELAVSARPSRLRLVHRRPRTRQTRHLLDDLRDPLPHGRHLLLQLRHGGDDLGDRTSQGPGSVGTDACTLRDLRSRASRWASRTSAP